MTPDLHPIGCARLVQAVVREAMFPRYAGGGMIRRTVAGPDSLRRCADRLAGLIDSPLIEHLSTAMDWDYDRVVEGMARRAAEWYAAADEQDGGFFNPTTTWTDCNN